MVFWIQVNKLIRPANWCSEIGQECGIYTRPSVQTLAMTMFKFCNWSLLVWALQVSEDILRTRYSDLEITGKWTSAYILSYSLKCLKEKFPAFLMFAFKDFSHWVTRCQHPTHIHSSTLTMHDPSSVSKILYSSCLSDIQSRYWSSLDLPNRLQMFPEIIPIFKKFRVVVVEST